MDFMDSVEIGAAQIAAGMHGASEEEKRAAQAFMDQHLSGGDEFVELFKSAAESWNQSPFGIIIKVPGLAGAEDYSWTEFALDAFLLVAGGAIASKAFSFAAAGSLGAKAAKGALAQKAVYHELSNRVGNKVAKKALQMSLKSGAAQPTDAIIKNSVLGLKEAIGGDIEVSLTPEEFKEAVSMVNAAGESITEDPGTESMILNKLNVI